MILANLPPYSLVIAAKLLSDQRSKILMSQLSLIGMAWRHTYLTVHRSRTQKETCWLRHKSQWATRLCLTFNKYTCTQHYTNLKGKYFYLGALSTTAVQWKSGSFLHLLSIRTAKFRPPLFSTWQHFSHGSHKESIPKKANDVVFFDEGVALQFAFEQSCLLLHSTAAFWTFLLVSRFNFSNHVTAGAVTGLLIDTAQWWWPISRIHHCTVNITFF
jgi:hypothetical protein